VKISHRLIWNHLTPPGERGGSAEKENITGAIEGIRGGAQHRSKALDLTEKKKGKSR